MSHLKLVKLQRHDKAFKKRMHKTPFRNVFGYQETMVSAHGDLARLYGNIWIPARLPKEAGVPDEDVALLALRQHRFPSDTGGINFYPDCDVVFPWERSLIVLDDEYRFITPEDKWPHALGGAQWLP